MKYSLCYKICFAMYLIGITILACCAVKNICYSVFAAAATTTFVIWQVCKPSEAEDRYTAEELI